MVVVSADRREDLMSLLPPDSEPGQYFIVAQKGEPQGRHLEAQG
jgi:hypothetical protein